jgi:hypothetical protein
MGTFETGCADIRPPFAVVEWIGESRKHKDNWLWVIDPPSETAFTDTALNEYASFFLFFR